MRLLPLLVLTFSLTVVSKPSLAGGPIASGSTVTSSVAGPTFLEAWTFAGTAGQRVIITAVTTSGALSTNIVLKAPGGGTETSTSNDFLEWQLAATGTYTIEVQDVGLNDAGNYALAFTNLTAGPLTSAGDLDGGAMVSGEVKAGTMSGAADIDAFSFSGTNGNRVLIDAVATAGAGFNTTILLYPPAGGPIATYTFGDRVEWQLTATGTWTVVIEDNANDTAGSYSFSFVNITAGPYTIPADLDGGTIASNEIKTGQFNQGVDIDVFTFTGTAGNRVIFTAVETGPAGHNTNVSIYPPGGGLSEWSNTINRFDLALAQTGTYTIVMEESGGDNTGTYTISMMNVTAGPLTTGADLDGGPVVSSEIKSGTMSGVGDIDAFTFTGTNGNRVLMNAVATAGAGYNTTIFLYPPAGGGAVTYTFGDRIDWQLTATGTWTIVIEDNANDTAGSYSLSFLNVTAGPYTIPADLDGGTIASNEIKTGQYNQGIDFDVFTFTGTAGNRVIFTAVETGPAGHDTWTSIYPPGGGAAEWANSLNRFDFALAQTGTYTIVMEENGSNNTGTYTISMMNVTTGPLTSVGDLDGGAIGSSEIKSGTTSGVGDIDAFTFSGTNGDRVLMDAVATAGAGYNTTIFLYPPLGGGAVTYAFGDRIDWQLSATGTWTIVIEDNANDTAGSYSVSFLNVTAGPYTIPADLDGGTIASNEMKSGQYNQGIDFDVFTFTGTAGNRVIFTAVETGPAGHDTWMSIYPPGGGAAEWANSLNRFDLALAQTGTYTIVMEENGSNNTGTYTISMMNVTAGPLTTGADLDGGPIGSSEIKSGTTSGVGDIDAFTFSGTIGNRVLMDAVATAGAGYNTTIFLYPPLGGGAVTYAFGDRIDWQLTATGTWTIVIEDNANDTAGSYSVSFLNVTAGPYTIPSDLDGGTIASNEIKSGQYNQGVDFDVFTFAGTAGKRMIFTAVETGPAGHDTWMSIYPPGGGVAEWANSLNRFDFALAQTGTYTIVMEENGSNNTGTYTISMLNVTNGPYTNAGDTNGGPIASNGIVTGTISGVGDIDGYIFNAANNNRILISGLATGGAGFNTTILLYPPSGGTAATYTFGDVIDFKLTESGVWTIVVEDNANDTAGNYTLSLLNVSAGPYTGGAETDGGSIVAGTPRNGSAISGGDYDGYTFFGITGQTANITATTTSGLMNTMVTLYGPFGGASVFSTSADVTNQLLSINGEYTIVVQDVNQDETGNYTLSLGLSGVTPVPGATPPIEVALRPASPSPFTASTTMSFELPKAGRVELRIFDVRGARVRELMNESRGPGSHMATWDGRDDHGARVASGVYYVQLAAAGEVKRQKVVLVR